MNTIKKSKYESLSLKEMYEITGGKRYYEIECTASYNAKNEFIGYSTERIYYRERGKCGAPEEIRRKDDKSGDVGYC
jgi:hypothetical protein